MTTNEILRASLLDILFDKRNKDYGAYALRRTYNHRLVVSVIAALVLASSLLLLNSFHKNKAEEAFVQPAKKDSVVIRIIEIPIEKPKEPELPKQEEVIQKPNELINQPAQKIARVKFVNKMVIKEDKKVKVNDVPINSDLKNKIIASENVPGIEETKKTKSSDLPKITGKGNTNNDGTGNSFIPQEIAPEFPGGKDALIRFLKLNLVTPEELQAGEKRTVEIRFKVGVDGLVTELEIFKSGGTTFDREVIRVCKKMPRWKPAIQNGGNIAVTYLLPITFIGLEQ
jgi:protein TonB